MCSLIIRFRFRFHGTSLLTAKIFPPEKRHAEDRISHISCDFRSYIVSILRKPAISRLWIGLRDLCVIRLFLVCSQTWRHHYIMYLTQSQERSERHRSCMQMEFHRVRMLGCRFVSKLFSAWKRGLRIVLQTFWAVSINTKPMLVCCTEYAIATYLFWVSRMMMHFGGGWDF